MTLVENLLVADVCVQMTHFALYIKKLFLVHFCSVVVSNNSIVLNWSVLLNQNCLVEGNHFYYPQSSGTKLWKVFAQSKKEIR